MFLYRLVVVQYLNLGEVNGDLSTIINQLDDLFTRFDDAVNGVSGQTIDTANLHREFFFNVIVVRIEESDGWMNSRLDDMESQWQARLNYRY